VGNYCGGDSDCYGSSSSSCDKPAKRCKDPNNPIITTCPCNDNTKAICGGKGNSGYLCYCYQGHSGCNCQDGSYSKNFLLTE
jgi:hypothetical protein